MRIPASKVRGDQAQGLLLPQPVHGPSTHAHTGRTAGRASRAVALKTGLWGTGRAPWRMAIGVAATPILAANRQQGASCTTVLAAATTSTGRSQERPIGPSSNNRRSGSSGGTSRPSVSAGSTPSVRASAGNEGGGVIRAAVGIDLGTTTSAVAVVGPDGRPVVVEDETGRAVIPSVVLVQQDGTVLVGAEAADAAESDPANAFYGIKRLMGRTYLEALREIDAPTPGSGPASSAATRQEPLQGARGRLRSYSLVEGPGGAVEVACPALGRNLTPQEVSSHLLRHLIGRARVFLDRRQQQGAAAGGVGGSGGGGGEPWPEAAAQVLDAVITVPAHFGPAQRRAVSEAARAAGLQRVTLLQEPIAAAMAYGFGSTHVPYDVLLVFDLGGGTLDLSVVEVFEGIMEVLSTSGDNFLGGDDFTVAVADWLTSLQQRQQQQPVSNAAVPAAPTSPPPPTHVHGATRKALPSCQGTPADVSSCSCGPTAPSTSSRSLALLRAAEEAKLALSEAVAAARSGNGCSGHGGDGNGGNVSVRVRLPPGPLSGASGSAGSETPSASSSAASQRPVEEVELSLETFERLVRPLLRRLWWPLAEVAGATRTQLGGRLPTHMDPSGSRLGFGPEAGSGSGSSTPRSSSGGATGSDSIWDSEGPGRREGAAAWEFSIFQPPPTDVEGSGTTAAAAAANKYIAPPRRLSGLVLVGAATRLPVVRDYITQVTGLPVRSGVDPETAVALGAALHAGLMVGTVTGGIEMNDGGYVSDQHGRASGFQVAAAGSTTMMPAAETGAAGTVYNEPELIWEP